VKGIPERVYPFNGGVQRNLYYLYCARSVVYKFEPLSIPQEIEERPRPYTSQRRHLFTHHVIKSKQKVL